METFQLTGSDEQPHYWFLILTSLSLVTLLFRSFFPDVIPFLLVGSVIFFGSLNFQYIKRYNLVLWFLVLFFSFFVGAINTLFISLESFVYFSFIYASPLIFWYVTYSLGAGKFIENLFFYIGLIMVLGSISQYHFIDPSLIGGYTLYQDGYDPELSPITLRSTSFIGSPQMLGFFCSVYLFFLVSRDYKIPFVPLLPLTIYGGLLSGSSAFVIALGVLFFALPIINWKKYKIFYIYLLPILILSTLYILFDFLNSGEDTAVISALSIGIESHIPYYLDMLKKIELSLFGQGFGAANRISEVAGINQDYGYYFISMVESAGLSIFHEQGILGILFFLTLIIGSVYLAYNYQEKNKFYSHLCLTIYLFLNTMATPVVTSYTGLIITYFILLNPLIDYYANKGNLEYEH